MSELEKNESSEILDSNQFLAETIFDPDLYLKSVRSYEITDYIKEGTEHIEMGSTTAKNLSACSEYLALQGIETEDPSKALDICTLRILKLLPGILHLSTNEGLTISEILFSKLVNRYILPINEEYLRRQIFYKGRKITLDQIMRENGAAVNIQRHITEEEMIQAFGYVRDIFSNFSSQTTVNRR